MLNHKHSTGNIIGKGLIAAALGAATILILTGTGAHGLTTGRVENGQFIIRHHDGPSTRQHEQRQYERRPPPRTRNYRLEYRRLAPEPRSWNPEPESCPRGVKVLRYGQWGC